MAVQVRAQQLFRYRSFHIDKGQPLGHGSYGAVYKAKCDQLPCAAKVLHPTILDPLDLGAGKIMERFEQECAFLESIRHPNIVQYLGMSQDTELRLPVLLMELLDESLTKMLERLPKALPYFVEVDICHDIALAIAYLHSNDIIHRDLSSNNVLMVAKRRAKVTDFGMSRISGAAPSTTPLTVCPGTIAYMSPEAINEPPTYTKKLDCFSEGVLMIQVCTRLWPEPGPRTKTVPFAASPTGMTAVPVLERERRKNHIDMIDGSHGLLPIAMDCLHYQENERPSSEELCERLAGLKETREYRGSKEQGEREQNDIAELERQIGEIQLREAATIQQLCDQSQLQIQQLEEAVCSKDSEMQQMNEKIQLLEGLCHELERQVHGLEEQLQSKQREIEAQYQQLNEQKQAAAPKLANYDLQGELEQILKDSAETVSLTPPPSNVAPLSKQLSPVSSLGEWRDGRGAPLEMRRGATVVEGSVAYFMHQGGRVYSFDSTTKEWRELPTCPCMDSSLAVVNGLLTAIGGTRDSVSKSDKLFSIVNVSGYEKWDEHFPPMPTKRQETTAVTTKEHLVVAGGREWSGLCVDTVEVMDIQCLVWSTAASLPHPYSSASATVCGERMFVLGGFDDDSYQGSVLTCLLTDLIGSCGKTSPHSVWDSTADAPVYLSTSATYDGELLAVGGENGRHSATAGVYKYNPNTESWNLFSTMPTARSRCLVAFLPNGELMVVGGRIGSGPFSTNKVEIACVQYNLS